MAEVVESEAAKPGGPQGLVVALAEPIVVQVVALAGEHQIVIGGEFLAPLEARGFAVSGGASIWASKRAQARATQRKTPRLGAPEIASAHRQPGP